MNMDTIPGLNHTLLFAGLCALLQCTLTVLVIIRRAQTGVVLSDGGDAALLQRIRAHGNFVETAPIALLLMALLEWRGLASWAIVSLGVVLVVGRSIHALGLLGRLGPWARITGMSMTLVVISTQAVCCLWLFARG